MTVEPVDERVSASEQPRHVRQPFAKEPDFGVTSVNHDRQELPARIHAAS
jgi:hypothetical protein